MQCSEMTIPVDYESCGLVPPSHPAVMKCFIQPSNDRVYSNKKRPAIIICPGGGYWLRAYHEDEPIALAYLAAGFQAFVLEYSVAPMKFPGSLLELSMAVAMVRKNAQAYHIDPDRIYVLGFSAGGHLAASGGVYWKAPFVQRALGIDMDENRINGMVLCYPVISGKEGICHTGSMQNLFGGEPSEEQRAIFSLENQVTDFTPPAFLWHTSDDAAVDSRNSLFFAAALREYNIPYELHVYPRGAHGIGMASKVTASHPGDIVPECQTWVSDSIRFLESL